MSRGVGLNHSVRARGGGREPRGGALPEPPPAAPRAPPLARHAPNLGNYTFLESTSLESTSKGLCRQNPLF